MDLKYKFTEHEVQKIKSQLEQDVIKKASQTAFVFAVLFSVYGVMSTGIITKYDSHVTMWSNSWPRILFNGIPFVLLGLFLRNRRASGQMKAFIWAILQPLIFVGACCVHVWPLMFAGNLEIYKYFHAANMFVITFGFIFVAPNRTVLIIHLASYTLAFLAPLLYLTHGSNDLSSMIVNDYICMTLGAAVAATFTYDLKEKIAFMDAQIKSTLTPFVGNTLATAIYNDKLDSLNNKKAFGLILSMDLRSYTHFIHTTPKDVSSNFMKEYHFLVSTTVGKYNGFIHKTTGDGHLISFGLMDESADLSDIQEIRSEVVEAEYRKAKILAENAVRMFDDLIIKYEKLKFRYDISERLTIGAALAAGPIEIQIQGDENYRQEVNIEGDTIARSSRLEAYTKFLVTRVKTPGSMLIISPEVVDDLGSEVHSRTWYLKDDEVPVRDFPDLKKVFYRSWASDSNQSEKKVS